jgi:hypothetical protein
MHTPMWELDILITELGFVAALDLQQTMQATVAPHMKQEDRRALVRSLDERSRPRGYTAPEFKPEMFGDLDAAAAFLTSMGVEVRRVKAS